MSERLRWVDRAPFDVVTEAILLLGIPWSIGFVPLLFASGRLAIRSGHSAQGVGL